MPQVRFSKDGSKWDDGSSIKWSPVPELVKLVIGDDPDAKDDKRIRLASDNLPAKLAELYPKLTHLHLWGIAGLSRLPKLPEGLRCLDVRGCPDLALLTNLPEGLEELLIDSASQDLKQLPDTKGGLKELRELSFNNCSGIDEGSFDDSIAISPDSKLQRLILSGTSITDLKGLQFSATEQFGWPGGLVDLRLSDMEKLVALAPSLPVALRRLEIKNVTGLSSLPAFPNTLDYIDLQGLQFTPLKDANKTTKASTLPVIPVNTRTLLLHGGILNIAGEDYGTKDQNVVESIRSNQLQAKHDQIGKEDAGTRVTGLSNTEDNMPDIREIYDHEVKVIMLGNGRCGKTSVARRLKTKKRVNPNEKSTHGVYLWKLHTEFDPVDAVPGSVKSKSLVNIWDFAGQDIYHNTHRIFLQNRAIFLICETDHPKGYNKSNDQDESSFESPNEFDLPGQDVDHNRQYWIDQVHSLGKRPGTNDFAPIIFVKTKCDRPPNEKRADCESKDPEGMIYCSADNGVGFGELEERLSEEISKLLGNQDTRYLGSGRMQVKKAIAFERDGCRDPASLDQNKDAVNTYITYRRFVEIVKEYGIESDRAKPELLLERLHRSGFLFDGRNLRKTNHQGIAGEDDIVLLDQRWAVRGIYAVLDRKKCLPKIIARKGRFTLSDLSEWVWGDFSESTRNIFLNFMQQCGICFRIQTETETKRGEAVYTLPEAWPNEADVATEAAEFRHEVPANGAPIVLENNLLGRDAVVQLLVRLGQEWRRSSHYWQWGGQFRSYRNTELQIAPTFVTINWQPSSPVSFGGKLVLQLYGPDKSFLLAILKEMRDQPKLGFDVVSRSINSALHKNDPDLAKHWIGSRRKDDAHESDDDRFNPSAFRPPAIIAKSVTVAISYAGDQQKPKIPWHECTPNSIERWPRALASILRRSQFHVEEFRFEQSRPEHMTAVTRKQYLDKIANQDYMFAFVSQKYLHSRFCMYELSEVYRQLESIEKLRERLSLIRFNNGSGKLVSGDKRVGELSQNVEEFSKHWMTEKEKFLKDSEKDGSSYESNNAFDIHNRLEKDPTAAWFFLVNDKDQFQELISTLVTFNFKEVGLEPTNEQLTDFLINLSELLDRNDVFFDYAARAWKSGKRERAMKLYRNAIRRVPDNHEGKVADILNKSHGMNVLDDIRRAVKEEFDRDPQWWDRVDDLDDEGSSK